MREFFASLVAAVVIGGVAVFLLVSWFGSLELPR